MLEGATRSEDEFNASEALQPKVTRKDDNLARCLPNRAKNSCCLQSHWRAV